jgi:hypothetical protein
MLDIFIRYSSTNTDITMLRCDIRMGECVVIVPTFRKTSILVPVHRAFKFIEPAVTEMGNVTPHSEGRTEDKFYSGPYSDRLMVQKR